MRGFMAIELWFFPVMTVFLSWGVMAFLPKLILKTLSPLDIIVYQGVLFLAMVCLVVFFFFDGVEWTREGALFGIATGMMGTLGQYFNLRALRVGPVSGVVLIASLYPGVAVLLAYLVLGEPVTLRQFAGFVLGLTAIVLLVRADDKRAV